MGLLDGKVAIITGAGGGLGEAYARLFAREGAAVVVNDLGGARDGSGDGSVSAAQKVVNDILAEGGRAVANGDDVSTMEGGENILKTALDAFGQVDILVCNAGILRDKSFANTSEADWDLVVKVHLKGTYCCTMPVWKWLKDNGRPGVIVMTSSTSGLYGNFGQSNYGAAKAGIYGFMRVLAIEGRKYGIRVMGLAPGAYTRMTADLPGRAGREPDPLSLPENVAPGVLYMVSDLAADHTGKVLGVSSRGVREIKMLETEGFQPGRPYTAQEVAEHAGQVFFAESQTRTAPVR
ncbi:MAG: SDR family NAD(P)-dependent oxidoreductase [Phenylobacterium sp.]|jgi:NAD(P)-dependent dehydrogenase (short-subunit alcohol dehydrogenase family)|uniref:SDR family NAD(P)-dependent oxidoreductase n=1 Tax=Phenylobacterium sp. TaxID=1871053 RepID=UPI0025E84A8F|nr:SDR family NAD(P)-dependent oxidoreductase [Phenylobacterium sp.]MCA3708441.1 SDR family NAD(P)-dependent oxidoreductase [Phenylobacterium sp.]MCA3711522.1 SDR family NAD(P)-dependent oxidoreductase [Phenylobacterium sp.]MCA3722781.1 SDR family NAD(P)-dependent oxidoreductase [Phenylobacterium sp.]MCA3726723.1 SDR family NAD(P)-dependent oxidoreductase [Phenylobacterium sp.]MCA3729213.1 SDR family NAD(P)-dependent oxidoreductase [Phenylobacterium sp.]